VQKWIYIGGSVVVAGAAAYFLMKPSPEAQLQDQWAMLDRYCVDCHNDAEFTADLSFEGRRPDNVHTDPAVWEEVLRKLTIHAMPPRKERQPPPEMVAQFVEGLRGTLDAAAAANPYAGSTTVHRLNRAEYANAVRDVLGVEADLSSLLPSDGGDFGFDNIAEVLTTSPLLLERYLTVALRVADMAVGNPEAALTATEYRVPFELTQDKHLDGMPLGTRGGTRATHTFPADGEYVFSGRLVRGVEEGLFGVEGHDRPHEFLVLVDGNTVFSAEVGGAALHELSVAEGINVAQDSVNAAMTSPPIPITAGPHEVAFTWRERSPSEQNAWEPGLRASLEAHNPSGMPRLEDGVVEGPYNVTGVSETPTRDRIFVCRPSSAAEEPACASQILSSLARRAFRRSVDTDDIEASLAFYNDARAEGGDFDDGIRAAVSRMLVSPWFLFRVESDSADVPAGSSHAISDFELASRLSFFLWSTIPDDELLTLAENGQLREPRTLEAQVRRMVQDPRSDAMIENFVGQWLQLRNLESRVKPDFLLFPDFDDNLRKSFRKETELLFANVLREGRPVLHVRQRAARAPLRHQGRVRRAVPQGRRDGSEPLRPVRARQLAVADVRVEPHVADHSRQVHPDRVLEQSAADAAGRRSRARGERAKGSTVDGARAARAAPCEPGLRRVPQQHRSRRLRAREFRRRRQLARQNARGSRDRLGRHSARRHARQRARRAAGCVACRSESFREHGHRKDADLCTRSRFGACRQARCQGNRETCGQERLQPCVYRIGYSR
jgi:hypothetical protein